MAAPRTERSSFCAVCGAGPMPARDPTCRVGARGDWQMLLHVSAEVARVELLCPECAKVTERVDAPVVHNAAAVAEVTLAWSR